ncbi:MAG: rhodanese-like domain-containing protein [Croceitalea sp.]|nr:rhodanese-like domain-containing protein [Croceitalea sp.]MBT8237139.1 rhodanese-like domain-containing protein [Croceitalea sp.]NNC33248.1 rhodanese-like domain-containing protein [Croceitalea sp.]NNL09840.1 rhodanese-like domain-containing protein [Croceitalea sp.]NNM18926.1 rhodanese-like domain-containing protein [Croceitalea sp.]
MSILNYLFGDRSTAQNSTILDKADYAKAIKARKIQLVDVRTAREFQAGHIKGAKNIDLFQFGSFNAAFEIFDKSKPLYLYCQSGNRSQKAAKKLKAAGFDEIYDLKGGYSNWIR